MAGWLVMTPLLAGCFDLGTDRSGLAEQPGLTAPCYSGPAAMEGVGECRHGFRVNWADDAGAIQSVCFGEVLPAAEICNEKDDDCDGATDNQGACADDDVNAMGPPGVVPFSLPSPDRVGPLLVKQRNDGDLAFCHTGEPLEDCATRFVNENGVVYGVSDDFGVALEPTDTTVFGIHATVHFQQVYRGIPVDSGRLSVHLRQGAPATIRSVTAHVMSVRADLPTQPVIAEGRLADLVAPQDVLAQTLVVVCDRFREDGTALPLDEQVQHLAWRIEVTDEPAAATAAVYLDAVTGQNLGTVPLVAEDVAVKNAQGQQEQIDVPFDPEGSTEYLITTETDNQFQRSARAGFEYLVFLSQVLGLHSLDGLGTDIAIRANEKQTTRCYDCWTLPLPAGTVLGYHKKDAPFEPHLCCMQQPQNPSHLDVLEETVYHELNHGLLVRTHFPLGSSTDAIWPEEEATEHALVEVLAEMIQCRQRGICDWKHAASRDYNILVNPSDAAPCPGQEMSVEGIFDKNRFSLCKTDQHLNRLVPGYALRLSACLMVPGCSRDDCVDDPGCGTSDDQVAALERLARILYHAVRGGYMDSSRLMDLYAGLVQACIDLSDEPGNLLTIPDCAAIQAAFEQVGIAHPCNDPLPDDLCDGEDNDCDGYTDNVQDTRETLTRICWSGDAEQQHIGECQDGFQTCQGGKWGLCEGEVLPKDEGCADGWSTGTLPAGDGKDDDCDGITDEGCGCQESDGEVSCGPENDDPSIGCRRGVVACRFVPGKGWMWDAKCQGAEWGGPEICDGLDNDCDLSIDEEVEGLGACGPLLPDAVTGIERPAGEEVCESGVVVCDTHGIEYNECGGGVEFATDKPGQACQAGTTVGVLVCDGPNALRCVDTGGLCTVEGQSGVCAIGVWQEAPDGNRTCMQNRLARPEVCDREDNDCDGETDEGSVCDGMCVVPGAQGECAVGRWIEQSGSVICEPMNSPQIEACDRKDNDCDSETDEGGVCNIMCIVPGAQGECAIGSFQMQGGTVLCVPLYGPKPERCNDDRDNDCDGFTDEVAAGEICSNRIDDDCDGVTDEVAAGEICFNGIDDNCNGVTDEYLGHEGYAATDKQVVANAWAWAMATYGHGLLCDNQDAGGSPTTLIEYIQVMGLDDRASAAACVSCSGDMPAICGVTANACGNVMSDCSYCEAENALCTDGIDNNCDGCSGGYPCFWGKDGGGGK